MFSAERSGRKPILALWRRLREGSLKVRIIGSMLVELTVESYAVVDRLRVRFHTGLNLLTGETGSGKSIVVDALGLLFGSRASAEMVRTAADKARISGIFELPDAKAART